MEKQTKNPDAASKRLQQYAKSLKVYGKNKFVDTHRN